MSREKTMKERMAVIETQVKIIMKAVIGLIIYTIGGDLTPEGELIKYAGILIGFA